MIKPKFSPGKTIRETLMGEGFTDSADYICEANKEISLFINIESVEGVKNLQQLLAIDGVDGVFIGNWFHILRSDN